MKLFLLLAILVCGLSSYADDADPSGLTSHIPTPQAKITDSEKPDEDTKIEPWPDKLWTDLSLQVDRSGSQLTNIIFDQIDEFETYIFNTNNNYGKVNVKRTVFDNQDVLNTYTVNDRFYVGLGRSATEYSIPLVPSLLTPINFNLGINGELSINHIRQVSSTKYPHLPKVDKLEKEMIEESQVHEEEQRKWYQLDGSLRPRLANFWNPFINVWRIPWTKEGLKKLLPGDLISYSTSGYVSVGVEAGFIPLRLAPGVDLSVGAGIQTFVRGEFKITILKESSRFVRVKLTTARSFGYGGTAGARTNDVKVLDGFFLFEGKLLQTEIPDQKISVIPFKFGIDKENRRQRDLGYRFDLDTPEGEEAYEKAVRGNFKFAEDVMNKNTGAVTHLLSRKSLEKRRSTAYQLGINWVYQFGKGREKKDLSVSLITPDGKKDIFKSSYQMTKAWSAIWGDGEKQNFLFTTVFDETAYKKGRDNSFQLVSEALYEDVRTSGKEMQRYIKDLESVVGNTKSLPELPILVPKKDSKKFHIAQYSRSSFYFGQYFTQQQVLKFIRTDRAKAWDISRKSFDYVDDELKRSRKISKFFNHWMRLQETFSKRLTASEMVTALQDLRFLFKYHSRAINAMRAILLSLGKEEIDYFLTATNKSFGRIQFRGRVVTNVERLLQMVDDTFDFENKVGNYRPDLNARVTELSVSQQEDKKVKVHFVLPKGVQYMYFKILRTSGWKSVKVMKDFVYVNKGRFHEGENEFVIDPESTDPLDQILHEAFKNSDFYTFQMSVSLMKRTWGRVESFRFKYESDKVDEPQEEGPPKKKKKSSKISTDF